MAIIKIKRSTGVNAPTGLALGELAVTLSDGTVSNNGGRVFIGSGTEDANTGIADGVTIIGGKYFTEKLDHAPGALAANSAIIVDSDSKIDQLKIDQITIDGDTISSTGNLVLVSSVDGDEETTGLISLNGTVFDQTGAQTGGGSLSSDAATFGNITISDSAITMTGNTALNINVQSDEIDFNGAVVGGLGDPTANTDATTKLYVDDADALKLNLAGGTMSGAIAMGDNKVTGVATPTDGADATNKTYVDGLVANTTYTFADGAGDTDDAEFSESFQFKGANETANTSAYADSVDIATDIANNSMTFALTTTGVTAGQYGSGTAIPSITVDSRGRISSVGTNSISTSFTISDNANTDIGNTNIVNTGETLTFIGDTGVTTTVSNNEVSFAIGQEVATNSNVTFNDVTVSGNLYSNDITASTVTIYGDLTVVGNTTTVNTEEINLADNTILLNSNQDANTAPTSDAGIEVNRGSANNVSFLWDETNDTWSTGGESVTASAFNGTIDGGTF